MANLNELNLKNEELELPDEEEIPELAKDFSVLPQPGEYTFRLPGDMSDVWNTFEDRDGNEILSMWFSNETPLTVTRDGYDGAYVDSTVAFISMNSQKRPRGKEKVMVSDLQYLLRALEAHLPVEERTKFKTNQQLGEALMKHAGEEFTCTLSWNAFCNPKKDIRVFDEDGSTKEEPGTEGCGGSYYAPSRDKTKEIPKDEDGFYMSRFAEGLVEGQSDDEGNAQCPAVLYARGQLSRFKSAKSDE